MQTDILVVGAGPSGATAALNLAPLRRVIVVHRPEPRARRTGESLAPAARRLLADMGLMDEFLAEAHLPNHGNRVLWGGSAPFETDFLRDPDGHGWHLDRVRFDAWLAEVAQSRGVAFVSASRIASVERESGRWRVRVDAFGHMLDIGADLVIDAGGRVAPIARRLGARREVHDRLVCAWTRGRVESRHANAGLTSVASAENGWWYSAPLPAGERVLAFHTDADLLPIRRVDGPTALLGLASACEEINDLLQASRFIPSATLHIDNAHGASLRPCVGRAWLAAGDAALSFDPLSAQGIFNALYTGLVAAEAADRWLAGSPEALAEHAQTIDRIEAAYRPQRDRWYKAETRFPDALFWRRRNGPH